MLNLEIKYTKLVPIEGAELEYHPQGTMTRRFHITPKDADDSVAAKPVSVGIYFHPDGERQFLIIEDGMMDHPLCYTPSAMAMVAGFMQWLAKNKDTVYPGKAEGQNG